MEMNENLHHLRQNYTRDGLLESEASSNPFEQFSRWFNEALDGGVTEPNAMSLATVDTAGQPRVRTVLLKDYSSEGFTYYTNLTSVKSFDIQTNNHVSILFFWIQMERQIRIDGQAELLDRDTVDAYFRVRPRESQIGAWASEQSKPVASRHELEKRFNEINDRFAGQEVPTPPFWGGYRVRPTCLEFWQGRPGRLHDRLEYQLSESGEWTIQRLQP